MEGCRCAACLQYIFDYREEAEEEEKKGNNKIEKINSGEKRPARHVTKRQTDSSPARPSDIVFNRFFYFIIFYVRRISQPDFHCSCSSSNDLIYYRAIAAWLLAFIFLFFFLLAAIKPNDIAS